jgi:hypothetical protein
MDHDSQAILTLGWDSENQYVSPFGETQLANCSPWFSLKCESMKIIIKYSRAVLNKMGR